VYSKRVSVLPHPILRSSRLDLGHPKICSLKGILPVAARHTQNILLRVDWYVITLQATPKKFRLPGYTLVACPGNI